MNGIETKHTPGEWLVEGPALEGQNPNIGLWSVEGVVNVANHCTYADAHLIAAAPDMLKTLREAYDFLSANFQNLSTGNWHDDDAALVASAALAAIDKAEVRSS